MNKQEIKHGGWALQYEDGKPVCVGDTIVCRRGDTYTINGGRPPHKPSSTGRVWTANGSEFFPTVFDLRWVQDTQEHTPATNAVYVANGGQLCPFCGSENLTGEEINIDAGSAWQDIYCVDCSNEWRDTYALTGYAINK